MRDREHYRMYRLQRCNTFLLEATGLQNTRGRPIYPELSPPLPIMAQEVRKLAHAVAQLSEHEDIQRNSKYDIGNNAEERLKQVQILRDSFIKPLRRAARANARNMPDLAAEIKLLPLRSSIADTLKNAKTVLRLAKKHQRLFTAYGLPSNLAQRMKQQIEVIEKDKNNVSSARKQMKKGTHGCEYWLREGEDHLRRIDVILRNCAHRYYEKHGEPNILDRNGRSDLLSLWKSEYFKRIKPRASRKRRQLVPVI